MPSDSTTPVPAVPAAGTATPPASATPAPAAEGLIEIKVRGEPRRVTQTELIALAQKHDNVDALTRELSQREQAIAAREANAQHALTVMADLKASATGDRDALRRLAKIQYPDLSDKDFAALVAAMDGAPEPGASGQREPVATPKPVSLADLPPEVQAVVRQSTVAERNAAVERVRADLAKRIANDPVMGYISMKDKNVAGILTEYARRAVYDRVWDAGGKFDESMISDAIQEARTNIKTLSDSLLALSKSSASGHTSLGPAPNVPSLDSISKPSAPPKRPDNPNDHEARVAYMLALAAENRATQEPAA